jgi:hypothetical protein
MHALTVRTAHTRSPRPARGANHSAARRPPNAPSQDSGNLIPGHGGLLDRFDSYIFTAAVGWFYLTMVLPRFGLA